MLKKTSERVNKHQFYKLLLKRVYLGQVRKCRHSI